MCIHVRVGFMFLTRKIPTKDFNFQESPGANRYKVFRETRLDKSRKEFVIGT